MLLAVLAWALVGARLAGLGQGVATVNRPVLPTLNFFVAREDLLVLYGKLDCRGLGSDSVASVANQDLTPSSLRGSVSSVLVSLKRRGHRELHLDCGASRPVIGRGLFPSARTHGPDRSGPWLPPKTTRAHVTKNVPWLPPPPPRERRKSEKRQGAGGLETLFRGVKTRNVVENKGSGFGRAKQRPDMCMKTKGMTAQSRYVIVNKSS
jgi:hypothetical protein